MHIVCNAEMHWLAHLRKTCIAHPFLNQQKQLVMHATISNNCTILHKVSGIYFAFTKLPVIF